MIYVTGSKGFIGTHLMHTLDAQGIDLPEFDVLEQLQFQPNSQIVHAAAYSTFNQCTNDPEGAYNVNVYGTANLVKSAYHSNCERIVYISTGSAQYPELSVYGATKHAAEEIIKTYPNHIILRLGYVYGANKSVGAINAWLTKDTPTIYGGNQQIDMVHVDDVCNAVKAALHTPYVNRTYEIGSGETYTINQIYNKVMQHSGQNKQPKRLPLRLFDIRVWKPDQTNWSQLGYKPTVKLDNGLQSLPTIKHKPDSTDRQRN